MVTPMNRQQRRQAKRAAKRKAARSRPDTASPLSVARQAHEAGKFAEAEAGYDQVLASDPRNAEALHFKGLLQYQSGNVVPAEELLRRAIEVRPGVPMFHANLANVLQFVGKFEDAEEEYRKTIQLDSGYTNAHLHLAVLLAGQKRFEEAEATARQADTLETDRPDTLNLLASIARQRGDSAAAEALLRRVLEIRPDFEKAYSNLIFVGDFNPDLSFADQQSLRRSWAEKFAAPLHPARPTFSNQADPERKLRVGYVSGDFRAHSAQSAFGGVIFERNRREFEAYCYMTSANSDSITERFKASADVWLPSWGLDESGLAERIRSDEIDILVDLSGHSEGGKLLAFARKPAPIQITGWGHCTGTGMSAMDYFFADSMIVPPEDTAHCAEEVVNLSCCLGFTPPTEAPEVASAPARANGYVTFGCFNRVEKISDAALNAWSRIVQKVGNARLLLKHVALDEDIVLEALKRRLADHDIDLSRVDFKGGTKWFEHLKALEDVDIALDPFPNNGGVTTLETLWMGVPIVTRYGTAPASRIASSIVAASGHSDWVTTSVDQYVDVAVRLARDVSGLETIRATLRGTLREVPLGNPKLYAEEVETHYRRVWRKWCAERPSASNFAQGVTPPKSEPASPSPAPPVQDLARFMKAAIAHHGAGQFDEAVALYDQALAAAPHEAEIYHMKGAALAQGGAVEEGVALIQQAIELKDDAVDFHNNLGFFLRELCRLEEAETALRKAIAVAPGHLPAYAGLTGVLDELGRLDDAVTVSRNALEIAPDNAELHHNLGLQLQRAGDFAGAAEALGRAAEMVPRAPEIRNNLANVLMELGDMEAAEASFREAVRLKPDYSVAWQNLGSLLAKIWRPEEAVESFRQALTHDPQLVQAYVNLAAVLNLLERQSEAAEVARQAIALAPETPEAHNNLGVALRTLGDHAGAEAAYRKAIQVDPRDTTGHSNLIFSLDFNDAYDIHEHLAERERWNEQHGKPLAGEILPHRNDPDPERKLRIGYVSADFRRHSAVNGFGPMIRHYDRNSFDVICYASNVVEDDVTEALRESATEWRSCSRLSHQQLTQLIREDAVDILVDLSGHSAGNRLLVFARKPAPLQVHAWGYANGTGLSTIDYFLTDSVVVPESERALYSETIRNLPSHLPYLPPEPCPDPVPGPYGRNSYVTFGSFNRLEKISGSALDVWLEILRRVPDARLIIKCQAFDRDGVVEDFNRRLDVAEIDRTRIDLLGGDPQPEHLAKHDRVDLMLDTFPHAGGISTADALWMGVPVVSLHGSTNSGRVGASALHAIGLDELIASDTTEYIDIAVRMAQSPERLAELRGGMRQRIAASPMGDMSLYVAAVEAIYRDIWWEWCRSRTDT